MVEIRKGIYKDESSGEDKFIVNLEKVFFEKESIMSAIYDYSSSFFTSMNSFDDKVSVFFTPKNEIYDLDLIENFSNKVVEYQIKRDLEKEYSHIRDTIVEYAYSPLKKKLI